MSTIEPKLSDYSNNKARDCSEKLMSDTFFSATNNALIAPTQFVDIQMPYLNNPIAFIRFEGQSLAVTFLKSLNLGRSKNGYFGFQAEGILQFFKNTDLEVCK